jgi:hypothetical protein
MQVSSNGMVLEAYSKLLKNTDTSSTGSSALMSAKSAANPLLIGDSSASSSSSSVLDKVEISQTAIDMLKNYTEQDALSDEIKNSALGKFFQLGSEYFGTEGNTNLEAIIAALEENVKEGGTDTLLQTLAESNKAANGGGGFISYNTDVSSLFRQ